MASIEIYMGIKPRTASGLTSVPVWAGPESASHSSKKGAVLIHSSGYLDLASAQQKTLIAGVAAEPGHNDSSAGTHDLMYYPALPGLKFEATLEDSSNNDHALVITNVGTLYALQIDSTNDNWYLDENDTSNDAGYITNLVDPLTTVRGRVEFVFISNATIFSA